MQQASRMDKTETTNIYQASPSIQGFPGSLVVRNPPVNAEDTGLIPGSGRFPWRK